MGELIGGLLLAALYCFLIYLFFRYVALYLLAIGGGILSAAAVWLYVKSAGRVLFMGRGAPDAPIGPEPAFKQYFFHKAYLDYVAIVRDAAKANLALGKWAVDQGLKLFAKEAALFTWPLGVVFFGTLIPASVAAVAVGAAAGVVHLFLVLLLSGCALLVAGLLRLVEYASMAWRGIFVACPHAGCYKRISLPVYICPSCGAEHVRLIPGSYGVLSRRCSCGNRLPTLFLLGRNELPSRCPHAGCKRPLNEAIGVTRNIHLPIVGGPACGKTTFLMASMEQLTERAKAGAVALDFPEKPDERLFEQSARALHCGQILQKTTELSPDAFQVRITDRSDRAVLLYAYDAAGELYSTSDRLGSHEYYSYGHGIIFLIDPFSLPLLQGNLGSKLAAVRDDVRPSGEPPQDVYDRMVRTLRALRGNGRDGSKQPVAVVLTKCDALGVDADLAQRARSIAGSTDTANRDSRIASESAAVRDWLVEQGQGNLVRGIEHDFRHLRYFSCSALGRIPDGAHTQFTPTNVLRPVAWVLSFYGVSLPEALRP